MFLNFCHHLKKTEYIQTLEDKLKEAPLKLMCLDEMKGKDLKKFIIA